MDGVAGARGSQGAAEGPEGSEHQEREAEGVRGRRRPSDHGPTGDQSIAEVALVFGTDMTSGTFH